jgi:hypothetical protein
VKKMLVMLALIPSMAFAISTNPSPRGSLGNIGWKVSNNVLVPDDTFGNAIYGLNVSQFGSLPTYSATIANNAPAASATDIFNFQGSATKTVVITSVIISGYATSAGGYRLQLVKRSTIDTGAQAVTATVVARDSGNVAGTAAFHAYTANPTTGNSVGNLISWVQSLTALSSSISQIPFIWSAQPGEGPIVLHGTTENISINGNGASPPAGTVLDCTITWFEYLNGQNP